MLPPRPSRYPSRMIRAFQPSDEEEVVQVWLETTIPGQAFLPEDHWRAMEPEVRQKLMPIAETWVVEENDRIVAFMSLLGNMIGALFTLPAHQGRGHGRALVEHVRDRFDPLLVEVFAANHAAFGFYRSCGFVDHDARVDKGSGLQQLILRLADLPPASPPEDVLAPG